MKKCFSRYRLALFVLSMMSAMTHARVVWEGTHVPDVLDQDVLIKDDVLLRLGGTSIEAIHKDIEVTLKKNVKISCSWAGESQLYIKAAAGRKITFVGDHSITLVGSSQSHDDLLVVQSGPGLVDIGIAPGKKFKITSEGSSGGVQMYVLMYGGESAPCGEDEYCSKDEYCCDEYCDDEYCALGNGQNETSEERPTLRFRSLDMQLYCPKNAKIVVGEKSRLSFLSSRPVEYAQDSAFIEFDATMDNEGRMELKVKDTGAVLVEGNYTCQRNGGCITTANISDKVAAGHEAVMSVFNSRGPSFSAGLLVLNQNKTLSNIQPEPIDPCGCRDPKKQYGRISGDRYGMVIGANGIFWTRSNSYLDYVGLTLNHMLNNNKRDTSHPHHLLKMRNPSALIIDGSNNPESTPAQILFGAQSAVFLRSGIAKDGSIRGEYDVNPFTIEAGKRTKGIGNIVFDVQGELNAQGLLIDGGLSSKIELLSLEVAPTGGSLFVGSSETNFPLRTFNSDDGDLIGYNSGAFLINNTMNLHDTSLSHSDVNHKVFQDDDINSEPTYIGGQMPDPICGATRPSIRFINSRLLVHSDVAFTGVDLIVPNNVDQESILHKNNSSFVFYSNGSCPNNGTGRQFILGTRIGSMAVDRRSLADSDSHLDVMQLSDAIGADYPLTDTDNQVLRLQTAFNDQAIVGHPVAQSDTVHTIFLGNTSNISIGTNSDCADFNINTNPWLNIEGNYFSFQTRGGLNGCPSTSNLTGEGGIFVDMNGKLSIAPGYVAQFCVLVTKTRNAIVELPVGQVLFCDDLGVINGDLWLDTPNGQELVRPGEDVVDLVLNWEILKKDCLQFAPYQPSSPCCSSLTAENIAALPTIQGTVDNLIIRGTRLGDPATFVIDGGVVRNITFAVNNNGCCLSECENVSGQAPVALIVLQNNGTVVLTDQFVGATGVTIIANGSGRIDLAGNITLTSQCALVKGPDFAEGDVLTINSDIAHEIIIPTGARLDLRTFDKETDVVQFTGESQLAVEAGSAIITGLGTLSFANNSQIRFEAAANVATFFDAIPHGAHDETLTPLATIPAANVHNQYDFLTNFGSGLHNTDSFRIKLMGLGVLELKDNSQAYLLNNAFVGVETSADATCGVPTTDIELRLLDNAQFIIGELNLTQGGVLQIGNVEDQNAVAARPYVEQAAEETRSVRFTLTLNGDEANMFIGSQGFMGLGVGIERFDGKDVDGNVVPNENIVNTLFNVDSVTFNFLSGRFEHDRIFSGDNPNASLFAINGDESVSYNVIYDDLNAVSDFNIAGGGNMILTYSGVGGIHPVVLDQDGQVEVAPGVFDPRLWTTIMASSALQDNQLEATDLTGLELFDLFKTHDAVLEKDRENAFGRANSSADDFETVPTVSIDTVANGEIVRTQVTNIIGQGNAVGKRQQADEVGAVFVNIDHQTNDIITATQIGN